MSLTKEQQHAILAEKHRIEMEELEQKFKFQNEQLELQFKQPKKVRRNVTPRGRLTAEEKKERELILLIHSPYRECGKGGFGFIGIANTRPVYATTCLERCKLLLEKLKKEPEHYSTTREIQDYELHKNYHETRFEKYKATKLLGLEYK